MGRFWGLVFDYGDVNTKDFVPTYACRRPKPADPLFLNSFVLHSLEQRWQEMQAAGLIPNDPQALVIDNQALVTDPLELLEFEPHTIPLKYLEEFAGHAIRIGWSNMAAGEKAEGRALKDGVHTFYALSAIPPADVARHGELGLDSFQPYATPIQARQTHAWTAYEQRALEPAWLYAVEDTYRTGHPVSWPSVHSVRQINAFGYDIAEGCAVGVRKVVRAGEGINADDE